MPCQPIGPAGEFGVIKDLSSRDMKANAWSAGNNIVARDGFIAQALGYGEVYSGAVYTPLHLLPIAVGTSRYWMYASASKIYAVSAATGSIVHTNLTRTDAYGVDIDYSVEPNSWTSTVIGGVPVLNPGNDTDPPQQWGLDLTARAQALENWPADTYCRSMRSFKQQLVAVNITENGTRYPYMVWWSHPADPGSVPISWAYNDPVYDGGRFDLAEEGGEIVDALGLRDSLMIYRTSGVYRLDYVGGQFVNQASRVLGTSGAMNRNCIVELDGYHLVLTNQDVITHNGIEATSCLDKQARRDLFADIDTANFGRSFVAKNPFFNEVWICYPRLGSTLPDRALVWNYKDRTATYRDIPNLNHANFGPVEIGISQPWNTDSAPWSSDTSVWNQPEYSPDAARLMGAADSRKLYLMESSTSYDGSLPSAYVERRGLTFGDPNKRTFVRGIVPHIKGLSGTTVAVSIGQADDPYSDPTYNTAVNYTIGSSVRVDSPVEGRYIAVKIATGDAYEWRLDSYEVDYENGGYW